MPNPTREAPNPKTPPMPSQWILLFARNHIQRFPRADWPSMGQSEGLWGGWAKAFSTHHVTQAEAEAASIAMMAEPPEYLDRHLAGILKIVQGLRDRAAYDRNEGRFTGAPKFEASNQESVALFKRFCAAQGDERRLLGEEIARRAGDREGMRFWRQANLSPSPPRRSERWVPVETEAQKKPASGESLAGNPKPAQEVRKST